MHDATWAYVVEESQQWNGSKFTFHSVTLSLCFMYMYVLSICLWTSLV